MRPQLSFVIPVRNDAERLQRCLESIRAASSGVAVEVVVVDNGSTDRSARVARDAGAEVIVVPNERVAVLRNAGARGSRAELVAFIDADHEVAPGWAAEAVALFEDRTIAAAGAQYHAPPDGTWVQRMYDRLRGHATGRRDVDWLPSGNLVVRGAAFWAAGGFDASLVTCEDVDLCQRLRERGARLVEVERLRSVHYGDPATLGALFRGELWRGQDNLRVSLRQIRGVRDLPSVVFPMLMLLGLGGLVVGLPALAAGEWRILALAAVLPFCVIALRTTVLATRASTAGWSGRTVLQALGVAAAYEVARACSIVVPGSHDVRRRPATRASAGISG